jgi:predicted RNA-binding Zn ribbon-like protein
MSEAVAGARRFDVADAPDQLRILQSLLNTTLLAWDGESGRDDLADLAGAHGWLAGLLPDRQIELRQADLRPLRAFREDLRSALRADRVPEPDASLPAGATVELLRDANGELSFAPADRGWRAISGLVLMEMLLAQAQGNLRRLKACASKPCGLAFYDRSPNASRMWHNTACGNQVNLRASRRRRKAE